MKRPVTIQVWPDLADTLVIAVEKLRQADGTKDWTDLLEVARIIIHNTYVVGAQPKNWRSKIDHGEVDRVFDEMVKYE